MHASGLLLFGTLDSLAHEEKKLGTNTFILMSLRFLYLTGLSTHVLACVWYALACENAATVAAGEAVCREGTWAQHPGTHSAR